MLFLNYSMEEIKEWLKLKEATGMKVINYSMEEIKEWLKQHSL